jgi:hypothetical protein
MKLLALLKGKLALTAVASVLLLGGATAVFAATPAGRSVVQSITHTSPTVAASATKGAKSSGQSNGQGRQNQDHNACPGLPDAQNLAKKYGLSTASNSAGVMAICALHQGTFKGTTTSGVAVNASRVYGYGEIDQLLTYAKYLAGQDQTNMGGKLTDTNVSSYLAAALHSCGSTPLATCLKTNIPNYQPGDHNGSGNSNKPTSTPTPNGNKPTVTPTPHH